MIVTLEGHDSLPILLFARWLFPVPIVTDTEGGGEGGGGGSFEESERGSVDKKCVSVAQYVAATRAQKGCTKLCEGGCVPPSYAFAI